MFLDILELRIEKKYIYIKKNSTKNNKNKILWECDLRFVELWLALSLRLLRKKLFLKF